jgi:hypothetical protein
MKLRALAAVLVLASSVASQEKPRVYITDRDSWKVSGWLVASNGMVVAREDARVVREHTENVKTFHAACPGVTVTENKEKADYALVWDRTNWNETAWTGHQNNLALYDRNGDLVWSGASHRMQTAARDACRAITQNTSKKK